jgi:hypothetical protein
MLYRILNVVGNALLMHHALKLICPVLYADISINIGFAFLKTFSYFEIKFNKIKKYIESSLPEPSEATITEFILDGKIVCQCVSSKNLPEGFEGLKYNMILFKKYINNNIIGKVYISLQELIKPSNVRFMSLELFTNEREYQIKLETDKHSYYVENMIIDKLFLQYYLINELKEENTLGDNYKLILVDNDVNIHELIVANKIMITDNNYIIL